MHFTFTVGTFVRVFLCGLKTYRFLAAGFTVILTLNRGSEVASFGLEVEISKKINVFEMFGRTSKIS